jgi:hypothetical protein
VRRWNRFLHALAGVLLVAMVVGGVVTLGAVLASVVYVALSPPGDALRIALLAFLTRYAVFLVVAVAASAFGAWSALSARADAASRLEDD